MSVFNLVMYSFTGLYFYSCIHLSMHLFINLTINLSACHYSLQSCIHPYIWMIVIHSSGCLSVHSLIHSFINMINHYFLNLSLLLAFDHSFIHLCIYVWSFSYSIIKFHLLTHSLICSSMHFSHVIHSFIHPFIN